MLPLTAFAEFTDDLGYRTISKSRQREDDIEVSALGAGKSQVLATYLKKEHIKIDKLHKNLARESLESIVANVLEKFGFRVETNKMAKTKEGREIEVDIWGVKTIGNTRFYVYASCKNWDKKIDRDVIFSEIGRISNLIYHPHLKIFVCKELTDPARETALTNGFTVIELREKANSENADEIAKIIYNRLNMFFNNPKHQRITNKKAKTIADKLKNSINILPYIKLLLEISIVIIEILLKFSNFI